MLSKLLKLIPEDPLRQAQFVFYLTTILFLGLLGYAGFSWYTFFTTFNLASLFQSIFMSAGALLTTIGVKQTHQGYITMKKVYSAPKEEVKIESKEEMMEAFDEKNTN